MTRLTHSERDVLRPVIARYARWESAHDGPVFEAVERIVAEREAAAREQGRAEADAGWAERLRMAERVCALVGWTAAGHSERDKAATQAWMEWSAARPGMSDRAAWPDLDDAGIEALARKRDEIRAATLRWLTTDTP